VALTGRGLEQHGDAQAQGPRLLRLFFGQVSDVARQRLKAVFLFLIANKLQLLMWMV
jgi:hypothetical protein